MTSLPILPGDGAFARNRPLRTSGAVLSCCWHKGQPAPEVAILGARCWLNPLGLPSPYPRPLAPWPPKPFASPRRVSWTGPHPHLLAGLPSAGEAGPPPSSLTSCYCLHDNGEKTFSHVSVPQSVSIGFSSNPERERSRMQSEKVPLLTPKKMLRWESFPYPPTGKAASLSKLVSTVRGAGGPKPGPRSQLPLAHLKASFLLILPRCCPSCSSVGASESCPRLGGR